MALPDTQTEEGNGATGQTVNRLSLFPRFNLGKFNLKLELQVQLRSASRAASPVTHNATGCMATAFKTTRVHGGELRRYRHVSTATCCEMTFAVFLPPRALLAECGAPGGAPAPLLYFLSGLTCTDLNFSEKAGAFGFAAAAHVALVLPDTSPRGDVVVAAAGAEATAHWDFGVGAGFYCDATRAPWSAHWRMESYVAVELPAVLRAALPTALAHERASITGHSMGGCGALALALKRPGAYRAATAFAPVAHPAACPWGRKAFAGYLGDDEAAWRASDPTALVGCYKGPPLRIRVDVGTADEWLAKGQLLPADFAAAAVAAGVPVDLRMQEGYVRWCGWEGGGGGIARLCKFSSHP